MIDSDWTALFTWEVSRFYNHLFILVVSRSKIESAQHTRVYERSLLDMHAHEGFRFVPHPWFAQSLIIGRDVVTFVYQFKLLWIMLNNRNARSSNRRLIILVDDRSRMCYAMWQHFRERFCLDNSLWQFWQWLSTSFILYKNISLCICDLTTILNSQFEERFKMLV